MIHADLGTTQRTSIGADVNRPRGRVDLYRRLRAPGDRDVAGCAEERLDLDYGSAYVNSIQKPARPGKGDGREYAQNAERDGELDQSERVSQRSSAILRSSVA